MDELIDKLPKTLRVLDVGAGGLQGENTSDVILDWFDNYTGICREKKEVDTYLAQRKEKGLSEPDIIIGDYYEHQFEPFDLVVYDLNIENNIMEWERGFVGAPVKDGGFLITYIMMTDQYGDPNETPPLLRNHWKNFWGDESFSYSAVGAKKIKGWDMLATQREERRKYILWVLMQKTSG